ncbi:hypothetical protein ACFOMD_11695 [Sphingoaurantiacus capsulatus]|uniref:DUF2946 domain-containing protein n=1 Tax=Sphingoaurantiacus capsulatus TaxID=1771310 RepID=A0ABV7XBF8_9SPHN
MHFIDRTTRAFALGGLALMLLLRILVPAGWMPAQAGGFAVTLCIDGGPVAAWIDADGRLTRTAKGDAGQEMPGKDTPCAFAAAGLPPLPVLAVAIAEPLAVTLELAQPLALPAAIGRGLAAPPPPATGPPATF